MSNKKSSRRAKRKRFVRKMFSFLLAFIFLLALVFVLKKYVFPDKSHMELYCSYESPESVLTMDDSGVARETPQLFAKDLAVYTGESAADPVITSEAGIIIDDTTGELLYAKNGRELNFPASVTKTMTLLVALKYGDLDSTITIEDSMIADLDPESSVAGFKAGDTLTLEQLLYGLMLPSGNDAANAIAYLISGSEQAFVDLMNQTALEIGATESHFMNAHGLNDPNHYTTAYDIYLIYHELMKYDTFYDIIESENYRTQYTNNGQTVENFWVRGIWYFTGQAQAPEGVTPLGGKTGTTPEAQYCLSLASEDTKEDRYVSVVLRAATREDLYQSMTQLLTKIQN